jgi:2-phospho-L-lactate guanylyltransferase
VNSNNPTPFWAVVPVKKFICAKTRLSQILTPSEREAIAKVMLHDVLKVLLEVREIVGIIVVTSDKAAENIAKLYGCNVLHDNKDSGTNSAIIQAANWISKEKMGGIVTIPADVPFTRVDELRYLISSVKNENMVLSPDRHGAGTNFLAAQNPCAIEYCFGPNSYPLHVAMARKQSIGPVMVECQSIAWDIDTPDDLFPDMNLMLQSSSKETIKFLTLKKCVFSKRILNTNLEISQVFNI